MHSINKIIKVTSEKGVIGLVKALQVHLAISINRLLYRLYQFTSVKDILVFESEGDLTDNAYALYDYMRCNGYLKKYKVYWLVNDIESAKKYAERNGGFPNTEFVKKFPRKVDLKWSKCLATCRFFFYDHSNVMHNLDKRSNQTIVYLTHGFAGYKAGKKTQVDKTKPDYVTVTSNLSEKLYPFFEDFGNAKFIHCGMPRLDYLMRFDKNIEEKIEHRYKLSSYKKVLLWMPTFRESNHKDISEDYIKTETHLPIVYTREQLMHLSQYLVKMQTVLILKIHPLQLDLPVFCESYDNILFLKDEQLHQLNVQLYQFIKLTDALITDYSSISADYMLLDKPMIFTVDDYEEYKKSRGGFIPNNAIDYWAGSHVNSLKEFYDALERIITNFDDYKEERKRLMPQFYEDTRMISAKKFVDFFDL